MARGRHRVRYKRVTAAGGSCAVTLVAVLGGLGVIPTETSAPRMVAHTAVLTGATIKVPSTVRPSTPREGVPRFGAEDTDRASLAARSLEVPADSGSGRRVVFDMTAQRVWLVGGSGAVRRTYLVSGSLDDNLDAGTYEVYSRSVRAWGIDDSGTMKYMVRFAHGRRAAIGFHDIPVKDGEKVQSRADLGTAQSHGCIRQWRPDAKALWDFAPVGTPVVVVD